MNVPLIVSGSLAIIGAGIHGIAGELLIVRKLAEEKLSGSRLGSPRATKAMIHVTWHIATAAFLTVGVGLVLAGSALDGDAARAVSMLAAAAAALFAAIVLVLGGAALSPSYLFRHPGPGVLTATAVLAWWGALTV